jgi:predicted ATPase
VKQRECDDRDGERYQKRDEELWCIAELLRIKGELVVRENKPNATESAQRIFRDSLDWATRQDALSWQLRTATSVGRLYRDRSDPQAARQALEPVYRRFSEGFGSADLIAAKGLLDELV